MDASIHRFPMSSHRPQLSDVQATLRPPLRAATILQNPRSPVLFDPLPAITPDMDASTAAAIQACQAEREKFVADAERQRDVPATDPLVVIDEEHALVQSHNASEALIYLVDSGGPELVEALLDYIDLTGGTAVIRRRLAHLRKDRR
jgi:hypothetical protein